MTSPVVTVPTECRGADAILTMLDHGIRHVPVITSRGEVLGVLRDIDLLAIQARTPFGLRHAIAQADDVDGLRRAYERLSPTVLALHDAHMNAAQISGVDLGRHRRAHPPAARALRRTGRARLARAR
jgi:CBS domain-containing protein